jgi:hypothetical protein
LKKLNSKEIYFDYVKEIYASCPEPAEKWKNSTESNRIKMVQSTMDSKDNSLMNVMYCLDNGYVYLELLQAIDASQRGIMLLDFEFKLKEKLDQALTIWHTPQGDKSSLRRLRGVEVKS